MNADEACRRALERLEEIARDPRTRERLVDIVENSKNQRMCKKAQRLLERLDAEYGMAISVGPV